MIGSEVWRVALDGLRANKLKAFLTMLGVGIGSACLVLVVTVALTGRRYILAQIEGVGSNLAYAQLVRSTERGVVSLSDELSLDDMNAVRQGIPQVVEVAATRDLPMTVVVGGVERPVSLVGVTLGFQKIRNLEILQGRYFDDEDMRARSKACLLTQELASVIFPDGNALGRNVRIGELSFTVIGVFRERISTFGQSELQRDSAIVPFSLMKYYTGTEYAEVIYAQAANPDAVPVVTQQMETILKSRHRPGVVYLVQNLTSILDAAQKISLALSVVLLLVAMIALLISGIGIMNIMLVTVTERTREIGVRKAIGARQADILSQFLLEAGIISGTGAVVGILAASSLPLIVQPFLPGNLAVPISWVSIAVAFLVSCSTGLIFGYLPARKAASVAPIESLRYE
ncbi:MAG: ABC transporter permease [Terriglobales bacterium]